MQWNYSTSRWYPAGFFLCGKNQLKQKFAQWCPSIRVHLPATTEERTRAAVEGGRWKWSIEGGWDRFSSNGSGAARNGATRSHGHAGKTKGLGKLSELPAKIAGPATGKRREGASAGTGHHQTKEHQSSGAALGGSWRWKRREQQQWLQWDRTATEWEALRGRYSQFPPSFHTLASGFCKKKKRKRPWLKRAMFPNIYPCVSGSGGPFGYYIFLIVNGEILICLLIQTGQI